MLASSYPLSGVGGFTVFFFNETATTEIYTLSLHDALPILVRQQVKELEAARRQELAAGKQPLVAQLMQLRHQRLDRKSTRLNASHQIISYAVFCLKKKTSNGCRYANMQRL